MADENNAMMEGQGAENKADKKVEKKAVSRKRKHKKAMAQEEKLQKEIRTGRCYTGRDPKSHGIWCRI